MRIAGIVLAAGRGSRMPGSYKLLEPLGGRPIVARAVEAVVEAGAEPVVVVTGHRAREVEAALPAGVTVVRNAAYADGLASSLGAGLASLPPDTDAALVALGDMPLLRAEHHRALMDAWRPGTVVVPTRRGRRGNPVLWSATFFDEMAAIEGDRGARSLLAVHASSVVEVPAADDSVLIDVDDADDLRRARTPR